MACHTSRVLAVSGGWVAAEGTWRSTLAKITTPSAHRDVCGNAIAGDRAIALRLLIERGYGSGKRSSSLKPDSGLQVPRRSPRWRDGSRC
jgi:hypothetical protein